MSFLRHDAALRALLLVKGHPYDRNALAALFESDRGVVATTVEHPAAEQFLDPEAAAPYDALVFYDMPGLDFGPGFPPRVVPPSERARKGFDALLEKGTGFVFLHHAIAGWPGWEAYGDAVGARFLYAPGTVRGTPYPDSGYRHDVTHRVRPVDPDHPVSAGVEQGFEVTDEVYLCPVFEDRVTPLFRSDHRFEAAGFYSAAEALRGRMHSNEGWSHPTGSNLIGWTQRIGRSVTVTLTCGDGPSALGHPALRRVVMNALRWVAAETGRA
jgi:hypothetical protein